MFPIAASRAEINSNRPLSTNQSSSYYQERAEAWVEHEGDIWARASVEGVGVQMGTTSLDYSGAEWDNLRWLHTSASENRNPNEENVWIDINIESRDPDAAEDDAERIMRQINSRLLVTFEFRGSETWVDERDPNTIYDDEDMVRVNYAAHVDFPWFVNELDESLPKEYGGIAANLDVTGVTEAWFDIFRHHEDDQFYEQLGVGFQTVIPDLEGGHELEMTDLLHLARIERSEYSQHTEYWFSLPEVEGLSSDPPVGEYEGYGVHEEEWYEGWRNAWRRSVRLNIYDPAVSFDTFTVWFDYQFVPRAFQTQENFEIRVDPFGNLSVDISVQDPTAVLTQSINYEDSIYDPVMNLGWRVNRPYENENAPNKSTASLASSAGTAVRDEPNIHLDIDFEGYDPSYFDIADKIAAVHGEDLDVDFNYGNDDEWEGRLHVHYYGWTDWAALVERVENHELNDKSPLYAYINWEEEFGFGNHIWFDKYSRFPMYAIGIHRWFDQYYEGSGEFYISTDDVLPGFSPLMKAPKVDSSHFRIEVPGRVADITPHKDNWGQGFDVWHHEWDDQGIRMNNYELNIFDETIELEKFGVLFDFNFLDAGMDIKGPYIDFRSPHQDEYVSGLYTIELGIGDDVSGVDESSVFLEVGSKYLLIDWTVLRLDYEGDTWKARWDTTEFGGDGTYNLRVRCQDHEGHKTEAEISVIVDNIEDDGEYPNIEFTEPLNGDRVSGNVRITAKIYDDTGLQFVGVTIDGRGYPMEHEGDDEYSYTWDSTTKADGKHEIVVIAIGLDGEEAKQDIMIESDNDITKDIPPSQLTGTAEPVFFIPGFSLLETLIALIFFGLLAATRKKRLS